MGDWLERVRIDLAEANAFVSEHHRHHAPVIGHIFSLGAAAGGKVVGVVIVGRPVARMRDDGETAEITNGSGPIKMGLPLAAFLGLDTQDVDTDEQAVYLIFRDDVAIMNHAIALANRQQARETEADGAIAGNSKAVSP